MTVRDDVARKYPGWTPSLCTSCWSEGRVGRQADSLLASAGGGAGGGTSGRRSSSRRGGTSSTPIEENLTLAEVLAKYQDGPSDGVFTDGSCMPNPGPGGWGAVYVVGGEVVAQAHGAEKDTTNNRMELTAIAEGLRLVPEGTAAVIHTDSKLCVDTLTSWAHGWSRRGWRRKSGEVSNLDLVKPLYEALQERPELELQWVKAHAGNRWNEYADSLATAWARDEL